MKNILELDVKNRNENNYLIAKITKNKYES